MEAFYRMYTARHRIVSEYFVQQVRAAAGSILDHEQPSQTAVENASDLIIASAMVGGLTRLLAEKLLLLEGQNTSEAAPAAEPTPDCPAQPEPDTAPGAADDVPPEPEEPTAEAVGEAEACSSS